MAWCSLTLLHSNTNTVTVRTTTQLPPPVLQFNVLFVAVGDDVIPFGA